MSMGHLMLYAWSATASRVELALQYILQCLATPSLLYTHPSINSLPLPALVPFTSSSFCDLRTDHPIVVRGSTSIVESDVGPRAAPGWYQAQTSYVSKTEKVLVQWDFAQCNDQIRFDDADKTQQPEHLGVLWYQLRCKMSSLIPFNWHSATSLAPRRAICLQSGVKHFIQWQKKPVKDSFLQD